MQYYKNDDGTYKGKKIINGIDEKGKLYKDITLEYPRMNISKWVDDIEFGIPLEYEILTSLNIDSTMVDIFIFNDSEILP